MISPFLNWDAPALLQRCAQFRVLKVVYLGDVIKMFSYGVPCFSRAGLFACGTAQIVNSDCRLRPPLSWGMKSFLPAHRQGIPRGRFDAASERLLLLFS